MNSAIHTNYICSVKVPINLYAGHMIFLNNTNKNNLKDFISF